MQHRQLRRFLNRACHRMKQVQLIKQQQAWPREMTDLALDSSNVKNIALTCNKINQTEATAIVLLALIGFELQSRTILNLSQIYNDHSPLQNTHVNVKTMAPACAKDKVLLLRTLVAGLL